MVQLRRKKLKVNFYLVDMNIFISEVFSYLKIFLETLCWDIKLSW